MHFTYAAECFLFILQNAFAHAEWFLLMLQALLLTLKITLRPILHLASCRKINAKQRYSFRRHIKHKKGDNNARSRIARSNHDAIVTSIFVYSYTTSY